MSHGKLCVSHARSAMRRRVCAACSPSVLAALAAARDRTRTARALHGIGDVADLILRVFIGGSVVSACAAIGALFQPKTFAGLFGAAPSIATATLALTYVKLGAADTATSARWMVIGAGALFVYATCCVLACRQRRIPVWLGAVASWLVWAAAAYALWWMLRGVLVA